MVGKSVLQTLVCGSMSFGHGDKTSVTAIVSRLQIGANSFFLFLACPSSQYHGYESQFGLRLTAGVGQFSASGAHAKEAENGRANSTGVWSPSELCGRR